MVVERDSASFEQYIADQSQQLEAVLRAKYQTSGTREDLQESINKFIRANDANFAGRKNLLSRIINDALRNVVKDLNPRWQTERSGELSSVADIYSDYANWRNGNPAAVGSAQEIAELGQLANRLRTEAHWTDPTGFENFFRAVYAAENFEINNYQDLQQYRQLVEAARVAEEAAGGTRVSTSKRLLVGLDAKLNDAELLYRDTFEADIFPDVARNALAGITELNTIVTKIRGLKDLSRRERAVEQLKARKGEFIGLFDSLEASLLAFSGNQIEEDKVLDYANMVRREYSALIGEALEYPYSAKTEGMIYDWAHITLTADGVDFLEDIHDYVGEIWATRANTLEKKQSLTPEQVAKLTRYRDRINNTLADLIQNRAGDTYYQEKYQYLDVIVNRINWLLNKNQELAESQPATGSSTSDENNEVNLSSVDPQFLEVADPDQAVGINEVADHIITKDYTTGDPNKVATAVKVRIKWEKERNAGNPAMIEAMDLLGLAAIMFADGTFNKNVSLNMDELAAIMDGVRAGVGEGKATALDRYDQFRNFEWYQRAIEPISLIALQIMSHQDKSNPWPAAGTKWDTGKELMIFAENLLYNNGNPDGDLLWENPDKDKIEVRFDPTSKKNVRVFKGRPVRDAEEPIRISREQREAYQDFVNSVPAARREEIRDFVMFLAWCETCICDYRTKAAIKNLGERRSALKHATGIVTDGEVPQVIVAKIPYKTEKNKDQGVYATHGVWIELPENLRTRGVKRPGFLRRDLTIKETGETHHIEHTIERYLEIKFKSRKTAHFIMHHKRWQPVNVYSGMPTLDEVLHSPDKTKLLTGEVVREQGATVAAFEQTKKALQTLIEKTHARWTHDPTEEWAKMSDNNFFNMVTKEIGELGTEAAKALAYLTVIPHPTDEQLEALAFSNKDSEGIKRKKSELLKLELQRTEMFELARAAMDNYIIYVLAHIQPPESVLAASGIALFQQTYIRRYETAISALQTYLTGNSSLYVGNAPYVPRRDFEVHMKETQIETGKSKRNGDKEVIDADSGEIDYVVYHRTPRQRNKKVAALMNTNQGQGAGVKGKEKGNIFKTTWTDELMDTVLDPQFKIKVELVQGDDEVVDAIEAAFHRKINNPALRLSNAELLADAHWHFTLPSSKSNDES